MTDSQSKKPKGNSGDPADFLSSIRNNAPRKKYVFGNERDLVTAINKVVAVVPLGSKLRFLFTGPNGEFIFRGKEDAAIALSQYQLVRKDEPPVSGFTVWLRSKDRREYSSVVFDPKTMEARSEELNLWRGFAVEPKESDWSLFREHLFENICQKNQRDFDFLTAVLAQMFQEPWRKIGIAVVLRGGMGVGKSFVSDALGSIIGRRYAPVIDKPEQLTGRFTGQLEHALLARVEEGYYPGDPTSKAAMKHLITGATLMIERKGIDLYERANFTRVLITTNSKWAVSAQVGERRYFLLDVGDARKQDGKYFAAIAKQLKEGGEAAFLHYLLHLDISKVDFSKPPLTAGLQEQIRLGFSDEEKWLESALTDGRFHYRDQEEQAETLEWPLQSEFEIDKDMVFRSYSNFVRLYRSTPTPQALGTYLSKAFPGIKERRPLIDGKRVRQLVLPSLADARTMFIAQHPGYEFLTMEEKVIELKEQRNRFKG